MKSRSQGEAWKGVRGAKCIPMVHCRLSIRIGILFNYGTF